MAETALTGSPLDRDFLQIRARLLELAAALDRVDRVGGAESDPRLAQIRRSLSLIASQEPNRAEQVQMVFSLEARA